MNKAELVEEVAGRVGLTKKEADNVNVDLLILKDNKIRVIIEIEGGD